MRGVFGNPCNLRTVEYGCVPRCTVMNRRVHYEQRIMKYLLNIYTVHAFDVLLVETMMRIL